MAEGAGDSPPRASVEHVVPGRMRLRVTARRGDAGYFGRVRTALAGLPGVREVRVNPRTGSILVEHGGDGAALLASGRAQGLFDAEAPDRALARPGAARGLPAAPLDLAAAGLAGAGVLQIVRGQVVGSASENLWNAYGLYAATRQILPSAILVAFGLVQIARGEVLGSATSLFLYAYSARRMARHRPAEETI
jgi:hypothetical protein